MMGGFSCSRWLIELYCVRTFFLWRQHFPLKNLKLGLGASCGTMPGSRGAMGAIGVIVGFSPAAVRARIGLNRATVPLEDTSRCSPILPLSLASQLRHRIFHFSFQPSLYISSQPQWKRLIKNKQKLGVELWSTTHSIRFYNVLAPPSFSRPRFQR